MLDSKLRAVIVGCACLLANACAGSLGVSASKSATPPAQPAPSVVAPPPSAAAEVAPQPDATTSEHDVVESQLSAASFPSAPASDTADVQAPAASDEDDAQRYVDVVTEQGQRAHGLYFNAPMALRLGARGVANMVLGAGLDAAVIDIKDGEGRITYDSQVSDVAGSKHVLLRDAPGFVRELKKAGVYAIARIVCFSDPNLPRAFPDRAILDGRPGHEGDIWEKNAKRNTWLDPYNEKNHDTIVEIAKEAEVLGFDEVQLDYIRFPVDVATKFAVFPAQTDQPRAQVILSLLRKIDAAIHIPLGTDVFGLTAFKKGDPTGLLGQELELWAKYVEVFTPMLYVYGMAGWMRHVPQGRAGLLVEQGVKELRERVGAGPVIRPFLQAFPNRADYYNPEFIAEQIRGARNGGGDGFLFWHPGSNYGMVRAGMQGPARPLVPFPIEARRAFRAQAWGQDEKPAAPEPAVANEPRLEKPAS